MWGGVSQGICNTLTLLLFCLPDSTFADPAPTNTGSISSITYFLMYNTPIPRGPQTHLKARKDKKSQFSFFTSTPTAPTLCAPSMENNVFLFLLLMILPISSAWVIEPSLYMTWLVATILGGLDSNDSFKSSVIDFPFSDR